MYALRSNGFGMVENSQTTSRPPGRTTRAISRSPRPGRRRCAAERDRRRVEHPVAERQPRRVPTTKPRSGRRRLPAWTMPAEKSHGTTRTPRSAKGSLEGPSRPRGPARSPRPGVDGPQDGPAPQPVLTADRTSFVRSYFSATSSNMPATCAGRLLRSASSRCVETSGVTTSPVSQQRTIPLAGSAARTVIPDTPAPSRVENTLSAPQKSLRGGKSVFRAGGAGAGRQASRTAARTAAVMRSRRGRTAARSVSSSTTRRPTAGSPGRRPPRRGCGGARAGRRRRRRGGDVDAVGRGDDPLERGPGHDRGVLQRLEDAPAVVVDEHDGQAGRVSPGTGRNALTSCRKARSPTSSRVGRGPSRRPRPWPASRRCRRARGWRPCGPRGGGRRGRRRGRRCWPPRRAPNRRPRGAHDLAGRPGARSALSSSTTASTASAASFAAGPSGRRTPARRAPDAP